MYKKVISPSPFFFLNVFPFNVSFPLRQPGRERSWLKRAWCLLDEEPDGILTWAPFARVIIAKAKELGGQGVTFRRTLPRYVSKTSNISRPVEHSERTICLPTLRPSPSLCCDIIGASPRQHGFLLRINGQSTMHVGIPSKDYAAIGRREEFVQCAEPRKIPPFE